MDFAFSEDQRELRTAVRDMLVKQCPPDVIRSVWGGDVTAARPAWDELAAMGVLTALLDESSGGLGLTEVDLVGCAEEIGRAALPAPVLETAFVVLPLLAAAGRRDLVDEIVDGALMVTADFDGSGLFPYADQCAYAVRRDGSHAVVLPIAGSGWEHVDTVDRARPLFRAARADGGEPLSVDAEVVESAARRGQLFASAELLGCSRRLIELAVDYVQVREQFGAPIGSFQAIKHMLADALLAMEKAAPMVAAAAWAMEQGADTAELDVVAAKHATSLGAAAVARATLQVHGAMGYTTESDLHFFLKRSWALAAAWGDVRSTRARLIELLDLPGPRSGHQVAGGTT